MIQYSYVVFNPQYSNSIPIHVFDDYHELICYVRKGSVDGFRFFRLETNSWMDSDIEISDGVYKDAYNGFSHYKDRNY